MGQAREHQIEELAARQHGVVTRAQLLAVGLSASAVTRRRRAGRLRPVHLGVYRVGPIDTRRTAEMAAVLAGGPEAVLSHTSALGAWGLHRGATPHPVHVTVPGSGRGDRPGIVFHRVRTLAEDERAVLDRVPITSPARALVDAARVLGRREIETALAIAGREGLIAGDALATLLARYRGRPGVAALRAMLGGAHGPELTRSEAERRCLDLLSEAGLPRPRVNVPVGPYELDLFWPDAGLAVEIDGRAFHGGAARFEGDRRKDRWLRAHGIEVVRVTWKDITVRPLATAVQIGQIFALATARTGMSP